MIPRLFSVLALALMLPACTLLSPPPTADAMPRFVPSPTQATPGPVIALVLSGGSARGFAHVGVIKVLEAHGLRPSIIVGSSAGSLVGALYASGLTASELEDAARSLDFGFLGNWIMPGTGVFREELGLVRANNLQRFVERWSRHARIEHFPLRFAAVATDLQSGAVAVFNAGDAGLAVLASCAVPGLIAPVRIGGRWIADGQTSSPLPGQAARRLGADRIIAVDVLYPPEDAELTSFVSVLFQSSLVSVYRLRHLEAAGADLVIIPKIPRTSGQYAFEDREMLMAAGESAAREAIERIRDVFGRGTARGETAAR